MKLFGALLGGMMLTAGLAHADEISGFDENGAAKKIDTATLKTCEMIFDSKGGAFELCRMEKVEIRPASSNRTRPGASGAKTPTAVVYKRVTN